MRANALVPNSAPPSISDLALSFLAGPWSEGPRYLQGLSRADICAFVSACYEQTDHCVIRASFLMCALAELPSAQLESFALSDLQLKKEGAAYFTRMKSNCFPLFAKIREGRKDPQFLCSVLPSHLELYECAALVNDRALPTWARCMILRVALRSRPGYVCEWLLGTVELDESDHAPCAPRTELIALLDRTDVAPLLESGDSHERELGLLLCGHMAA